MYNIFTWDFKKNSLIEQLTIGKISYFTYVEPPIKVRNRLDAS